MIDFLAKIFFSSQIRTEARRKPPPCRGLAETTGALRRVSIDAASLNDESSHKILRKQLRWKKILFFVQAVLLQVPTAWFDKCVCVTECVFFFIAVRVRVFGNVFFSAIFFFFNFSVLLAKYAKPRDAETSWLSQWRSRRTQRPSTLPSTGLLEGSLPNEMC